MKGCARADGAFNVNFAGMFLDDSIGNGKTEAGAAAIAWLGCRLGGEEGIVDALEMFGRNALTGVCNQSGNVVWVSVDQRGYAQATSLGHGFLGIQQEIEKNLLQFAGVAMDGREFFHQVEIDADQGRFELVLQQRQRVAYDLVQIGFAEFSG